VLAPAAAGRAADVSGLSASMWILMGLCIMAGTLALGLKETAPACLKRRQPQRA